MNKPYIIAEVGSNWSSLSDCLESIRKAKECGADAVKFQLFDYHSLYGREPNFMNKFDDELALPMDWLIPLYNGCLGVGTDFMCSAFSPELIDIVNPLVKIHKVASAEMCHVGILEKLAKIGKPVMLSCGAHTVAEISQSLEIIRPHCDVTLMYCVASYPAKYVNTRLVKRLAQLFDVNVGFSDHTLDVYESPWNAVQNGAVAIEKHVNFVGATGPDSTHSLNCDEFKNMVSYLRDDKVNYGPTPDEADMVSTHNRRIVATCNIERGDEFKLGFNYGFYRGLQPSGGISPHSHKSIEGKRSTKLIMAGQCIE